MARRYRLSTGSAHSICETYNRDWVAGVEVSDAKTTEECLSEGSASLTSPTGSCASSAVTATACIRESLLRRAAAVPVSAVTATKKDLEVCLPVLSYVPVALPERISDWTPAHVAQWARSTPLAAEAADWLLQNEVGGPVLVSLTEADLVDMGFSPWGRRRQLLLSRAELIEKQAQIVISTRPPPLSRADPIASQPGSVSVAPGTFTSGRTAADAGMKEFTLCSPPPPPLLVVPTPLRAAVHYGSQQSTSTPVMAEVVPMKCPLPSPLSAITPLIPYARSGSVFSAASVHELESLDSSVHCIGQYSSRSWTPPLLAAQPSRFETPRKVPENYRCQGPQGSPVANVSQATSRQRSSSRSLDWIYEQQALTFGKALATAKALSVHAVGEASAARNAASVRSDSRTAFRNRDGTSGSRGTPLRDRPCSAGTPTRSWDPSCR